MTDEVKPTEAQLQAEQQLRDAVDRGLNRWREQRVGDPVPFIVDAIVDSSDPLGGYLIIGGVVRLVQEAQFGEETDQDRRYQVYTEPDRGAQWTPRATSWNG